MVDLAEVATIWADEHKRVADISLAGQAPDLVAYQPGKTFSCVLGASAAFKGLRQFLHRISIKHLNVIIFSIFIIARRIAMPFLEEFKVHVKSLLKKDPYQGNNSAKLIRLLEPRINELQSLATPLRTIQEALVEAGLDINYSYLRSALHRARKATMATNGEVGRDNTHSTGPILLTDAISPATDTDRKDAVWG